MTALARGHLPGGIPRRASLSLENVISVAEQSMERAGLSGRKWHVPSLHMDDPARPAAQQPVNDFVHKVLASAGMGDYRIKVIPKQWDLRGGGIAVTDGLNYIGIAGEDTNDMTLLHECAHIISRTSDGPEGHSIEFAKVARDLYSRFISKEAADQFWRVVDMSPAATGSLSVQADADTDGVMIALVPDEKVSKALMEAADADEPLEQQHLTLLYLGSTEEAGGERGRELVYRGCYDFALHSGYRGLSGKPNGWGAFYNPDDDGGGVLIALWDIPTVAEFRSDLQGYLRRQPGLELRRDNHGFTPHQTMAYQDKPFLELPAPIEVEESHFTSIVIAWGKEPWHHVALP